LLRHHPPRKRQRGATAVEFSLVFPLFMVLLFGAIDGGRFVISHCMLSNAVIVGGRLASVASTATSTAVQTAVVGAAPFLSLTTAAVTVTVTHGGTATTFAARATGDTVSVAATYSFRAVLPLLTKFASRSYTATSAVTVE
jgi:Flp pilus assembly protein TadG